MAPLPQVLITDSVIESARQLAWDHDLRGYDSVQLACALLFDTLSDEAVTVAAADDKLRDACAAVGLTVWPVNRSILYPVAVPPPPPSASS